MKPIDPTTSKDDPESIDPLEFIVAAILWSLATCISVIIGGMLLAHFYLHYTWDDIIFWTATCLAFGIGVLIAFCWDCCSEA